MRSSFMLFVLFALIFLSCSKKIFIPAYFQPSDQRQKYTARFYPRFAGSKLTHDSSIVFVRHFKVDSYDAMYVTDNVDTTHESDITLSHDYFLKSAIILRQDSFLLAPIKLYGVRDLTLGDFKFAYPVNIRKRDTISLVRGEQRLLFYGFKYVNITVNGVVFKNCLNIKITEIWPATIYNADQVWLHKKYGVVKWLRGGDGGRIEEIQL